MLMIKGSGFCFILIHPVTVITSPGDLCTCINQSIDDIILTFFLVVNVHGETSFILVRLRAGGTGKGSRGFGLRHDFFKYVDKLFLSIHNNCENHENIFMTLNYIIALITRLKISIHMNLWR